VLVLRIIFEAAFEKHICACRVALSTMVQDPRVLGQVQPCDTASIFK